MDPNNPQQNNQPAPPQPPVQQTYQQMPNQLPIYPNQAQPYQEPTPAPGSLRGDKRLLGAIIVGVISLVLLLVVSLIGGGDETAPTTVNPEPTDTVEAVDTSEEAIATRNTARKADLARLMSVMQNFATENNGAFPEQTAVDAGFLASHVDGEFIDPLSQETYTVIDTVPSEVGTIQYAKEARCNDSEQGIVLSAGTRLIALLTVLEGGNSICLDNK